jgi:hypothetical protein
VALARLDLPASQQRGATLLESVVRAIGSRSRVFHATRVMCVAVLRLVPLSVFGCRGAGATMACSGDYVRG